MDRDTLLAAMDFAHDRLMGLLDQIDKSGRDTRQVVAWRPGPGRAHIAWQAMHIAASHHNLLHTRLIGDGVKDPELVERFRGGTKPSDENVPDLPAIRRTLQENYDALRDHVAGLTPADLARPAITPKGPQRTVGEWIVLLTWNQAHHDGQIRLTWNLYQAHGA